MKNNLQYVFLIIIVGVTTWSCQTIETDAISHVKPVVEGYLAAGHAISVKVSQEAVLGEADTARLINGLDVQISVDGLNYPLSQNASGVYKAPASLFVQKDKVYSVQFNYEGSIVTASTFIPDPPTNFLSEDSVAIIGQFNSSVYTTFPVQATPINLTWDNPNQEYYLIVVKNIEINPVPIDIGISSRSVVFRSNPLQNNYYQIHGRQFQYYGRHWIILYKISAEYASLYRGNGTSSLDIKTPFTNITNGLGIFTGINADTLRIRLRPN